MEIKVHSQVPAPALRRVAERRARFAFRRLQWLAQGARIRLSDVNGTRGGLDKKCSIEVEIAGAPPLVVSSLAHDWRTAVDAALHRAARAVLRVWRKREARQRRAIPLTAH